MLTRGFLLLSQLDIEIIIRILCRIHAWLTIKTPDCCLKSLAQSLFSNNPIWVSCVLRDTDLLVSWGCALGPGWKNPGLVTFQIRLLQDSRGRPRGGGCRGALSVPNTGKHCWPSESMVQAWWDSAKSRVISVFFKGKSSKFMNALGRQMIQRKWAFFFFYNTCNFIAECKKIF